MSGEVKVLGISFGSRLRRRALVVAAYLFSLAYVGFLAARMTRLSHAELASISIGLIVVMNLLFGSIVRQEVFAERARLRQQSDVPLPGEDEEPDEYEAALPSSSPSLAYRVMAICFVIAAIPVTVMIDHGTRHFAHLATAGVVTVCILLVSLPQAVVLWQEPDFPDA